MSSISDTPASIGIQALPTSGTIILEDSGVNFPHFNLTFTLNAARVPVTDAAASGSFGALKLFDFVAGVVHMESTFQNFTSFIEGAALTGGAGDANFKIGLGSAAIAVAADSALTGTSVNFGPAINVTLAGGTGTGTAVVSSNATLDGTVTPVDLVLNVSGSAATIDANSYIDVTGKITVEGTFVS